MSIMNERVEIALKRDKQDILQWSSVKQIPIVECNEPLVNLNDLVPRMIPAMSPQRVAYAGGQILFARQSVANMLVTVAETLLPTYRLLIVDAYRPLQYQKMRYDSLYEKVRSEHPDWSKVKIEEAVHEFIAFPDPNPKSPSPHSTGGAIDVMLTSSRQLLDMGSEYGNYSDEEKPKHNINSSLISDEQRSNRYILIKAMVEAGFCSYAGEWWHYMYGDQEYAAYENKSNAIYGRADLLEDRV